MDSDTISPQVDEGDMTADSDSDLEQATRIADQILGSVIMWDDHANPGVSYALWVSLAGYLAAVGWTADQLASDAMWHATAVRDAIAQDDDEQISQPTNG